MPCAHATRKTPCAFRLLAALLCVVALTPLSAAPYQGKRTVYTQPDGNKLQLRVYGDEFYAETRTLDGYTLVFDRNTKAYFYARLSPDGNDLVSTGVRPGQEQPQKLGLAPRISINPASRRLKAKARYDILDGASDRAAKWEAIKAANRRRREISAPVKDPPPDGPGAEDDPPPPPPAPVPPTTSGTRVGLTILVDFSDDVATIPRQDIDDYCNEVGYSGNGNNGSIYDYFYTQSDGKLEYNNVVVGYVRMPKPKSFYNNVTIEFGLCGRKLLRDALEILVAEGFDFSKCTDDGGRLHAVNLFFAGNNSGVWSWGLWPHRWSLWPDYDVGGGLSVYDYQTTDLGASLTIGTFCHENGHMLLKYPDTYDYDGSSRGTGYYCLMSSSGTTHPLSVGAYFRYHSGWCDVMDFTSNSHFRASVRVDHGKIYRYDNPDATWPGEYFLIENRQEIGWEQGSWLGDEGLMFMHCDEDGNRDDDQMTEAQHHEVSIEQADGSFHLENDVNGGEAGDMFHSGDKTQFDDTTTPNAKWWKGADGTAASGTASGMDIHTISINGETMTFIIGTGALTNPPGIGLDRVSLAPVADLGSNAVQQSYAVWNMGTGTLSYAVSNDVAWLSTSPTNGTATTESDVITVSYVTTNLTSGTYNATITVTDTNATNSPQTIAVTLTVRASAVLDVSETNLSQIANADGTGGQQTFDIRNTGGGTLAYTATSTQSWLTITPATGAVMAEVDALYVDYDASGLSTGVYYNTITVAAPGASNSPQTIAVTLTVLDLIMDAPNGGESWIGGQDYDVTWRSGPAVTGNVKLELYKGGILDTTISAGTADDGTYNWAVASDQSSGTNYSVRITSINEPLIVDESDALFTITSFALPFQEGFEGGSRPLGWIEEHTTGLADWAFQTGGYTGAGLHPATAHSDSYNACLYYSNASDDHKTKLVTPPINCGAETDPLRLTFWHYMEDWGGDQDELRVYYKTSEGGSWNLLATYVTNVASWTERTISLPNPSSTYYVGFEGNAIYGWGVCVDDIHIRALRTLQIASDHGTPTPAAGSYTNDYGTDLANSVNLNDTQGTTQYVCTGWSMTGNVPTNGGGTNMTMTLTNDAVLTWQWKTQHRLQPAAGSGGSVDQTN
ncbi:M6 family metalloprotease domain-containing protein, partial [Verrucomicrobiota bacterium]